MTKLIAEGVHFLVPAFPRLIMCQIVFFQHIILLRIFQGAGLYLLQAPRLRHAFMFRPAAVPNRTACLQW